MSQTTYSRYFVNAFAGMLGDAGHSYVGTRVNGSGVALPAGIGVKEKSGAEGQADVLSAASDKLCGIIINSFQRNPGDPNNSLTGTQAILDKAEMNLMEEGAIFVKPEQTVAVGDKVYSRFATSANDNTLTQRGAFRKDADGAAQVSTGTPTAVNATTYVLRVEVQDSLGRLLPFDFEYLSDGSATAAEIVTGFKTLMAADAEFSTYITASGTATLILTAATAGVSFTAQSEGDGAIAFATGTPAAPTALAVRGARWLKGSDSVSGVALMYFSASTHLAS